MTTPTDLAFDLGMQSHNPLRMQHLKQAAAQPQTPGHDWDYPDAQDRRCVKCGLKESEMPIQDQAAPCQGMTNHNSCWHLPE